VVAGTPVDPVVAGTPVDPVVSGMPVDPVVAETPVDPVVSGGADVLVSPGVWHVSFVHGTLMPMNSPLMSTTHVCCSTIKHSLFGLQHAPVTLIIPVVPVVGTHDTPLQSDSGRKTVPFRDVHRLHSHGVGTGPE